MLVACLCNLGIKSTRNTYQLTDSSNVTPHDRTLPQVETPIFLGVKLDPRLSWKPQIDEMATKGFRKLALLKKLA